MQIVTKADKIRNGRRRGTTKVGEIDKKVREGRLTWYGHVMRGTLRRKEGDRNETTKEKEERKA